jgi:hypothetical protein
MLLPICPPGVRDFLLAAIARWQQQGMVRGDRKYNEITLVAALRRERISRSAHRAAQVFRVDGAYQEPDAVLVCNISLLLGALPHYSLIQIAAPHWHPR